MADFQIHADELTPETRPAVAAWLKRHGINPDNVVELKVDGFKVAITAYEDPISIDMATFEWMIDPVSATARAQLWKISHILKTGMDRIDRGEGSS